MNILKGKKVKGKPKSLRVDFIWWHLILNIKSKNIDKIYNNNLSPVVSLKVYSLKIK